MKQINASQEKAASNFTEEEQKVFSDSSISEKLGNSFQHGRKINPFHSGKEKLSIMYNLSDKATKL